MGEERLRAHCSGCLRHWCSGVAAAEAAPLDVERKPDGWHTYHICGGLIRELSNVTTSTENKLYCPSCNEWFDLRAALRSPDTETAGEAG
jgi:hypothetical protein